MKVITKATLDMNTMQWTSVESFDYAGPVALCKGDDTAKQAEQQQMAFQQQLMQAFTLQFGKQNEVFKFLKGTLKPMITKPTGFSPKALAAIRAQTTDNISGQYQNAQRALQAKEFAQGGRDLPSGVNAQLDADLFAHEAADTGQAQNQITLENEQLKQQNYWNSINALNGQAAEYNPTGFASGANSAGGEVAGLSQAVTASNQSQLLGALGGVAGGVGSALSGHF